MSAELKFKVIVESLLKDEGFRATLEGIKKADAAARGALPALEDLGEKAGKLSPIADLAKRAKELADSSRPSIRALNELTQEIEELRGAADLTEDQIKQLAEAEAQLAKVEARIVQQRVGIVNLKDDIKDATKVGRGWREELFDGATTLERVQSAATKLGGALAVGLATGFQLARKAGVDFTESMAVLDKVTTTVATSLNKGINKALEFLARGHAEMFALFKKDNSVSKWLKDLGDGLEIERKVAEGRIGLEEREKAAKEAAEKAEERKKKEHEAAVKLAEEAVRHAENEILAHGQTLERIDALIAARQRLNAVVKGGAEENRRIQLEGDAQAKEFIDAAATRMFAGAKSIKSFFDEARANENQYLTEWRRASTQEGIDILKQSLLLESDERLKALEFQIALGERGLDSLKKELKTRLTLVKAGSDEERRTKLALAQTDRALTQQQINGVNAWGAALTAVGDAAFAKNKTWAIARTIINTALGIMNVWANNPADYYTNLALSIVVAATGAAQLIQIQKQSAEGGGGQSAKSTKDGGFDVMRNDYAAEAGGHRWAVDMVSRFSTGAAAGFSGALISGEAIRSAVVARQGEYESSGMGGGGPVFYVERVYGSVDSAFARMMDGGSRRFVREVASANVAGRRRGEAAA